MAALVDMCCKYGLLVKAQAIFDKLLVQDTILCNALAIGYVQLEDSQQVVKYFEHMQLEGVFSNAITFT